MFRIDDPHKKQFFIGQLRFGAYLGQHLVKTGLIEFVDVFRDPVPHKTAIAFFEAGLQEHVGQPEKHDRAENENREVPQRELNADPPPRFLKKV